MKSVYDIIIRPIITEQSMEDLDIKKYVFEVAKDANKLEIKKAIEEIFDVMDERGNEDERYEKLERIWSKLKEVDRMILESYYVDGCRMEEIAKRIGYKNGNSVKSKKKKVLMKIMEMKDRADFKDLPAAA